MKLTCDIELCSDSFFDDSLGEILADSIRQTVKHALEDLVRMEIRNSASVIAAIRAEILAQAKVREPITTASLAK